MACVVLTLAEWRSVAHELAGAHSPVAPAGLRERIHALLAHAPQGWPEQLFVLEFDADSSEVVRRVHAALLGHDPHQGQRSATVAEALRIIRGHQQRP